MNFVGEVVPPQATIVARRRTIPLFGLGLVDAVPDETFVEPRAEQHANNPATAGRPSLVTDPVTGQTRVGRFGWKAQQPIFLAFTADANVNEMGVTTPVFPLENPPARQQRDPRREPRADEPERRRRSRDPDPDRLRLVHGPAAPGPRRRRPSRRGRSLRGDPLYRLPHPQPCRPGRAPPRRSNEVDVLPVLRLPPPRHGLAGRRDRPEHGPAPTEMRTAPLWGLRFQPSFLHDGRAATADQAIRAHDGQGKAAGASYQGARQRPSSRNSSPS